MVNALSTIPGTHERYATAGELRALLAKPGTIWVSILNGPRPGHVVPTSKKAVREYLKNLSPRTPIEGHYVVRATSIKRLAPDTETGRLTSTPRALAYDVVLDGSQL